MRLAAVAACLVILRCLVVLLGTNLFVGIAMAPAGAQRTDELEKKVTELSSAGRYSDAIPIAQQILRIREMAFGPDHPRIATSLDNLASLYRSQGELYRSQGRNSDADLLYWKSSAMYARSLAIKEKVLGPDHPDVAKLLNNLAEMYRSQHKATQR